MSKLAAPLALLIALAFALPALGKDPRREPKRLSSEGDSITEAINAEIFLPFEGITPNEWASWVNGKHGKWEERLDLTDVNSHNQRITEIYGKKKRKNKMEAFAGADSGDLLKQATKSVKRKADYVTVFIGHNDICDDSFADVPTPEEFEANVRAGFDVLKAGLPPGATVYTVGMIDLFRLWEIGDDLTALGILDCQDIWENELFDFTPCGTMFGPDLEDADRQAARDRIIAYNQVLADLSAEYEAADEHHYWQYTNVAFELPFEADDVSEIDCFHPSADGQARLAEETWNDGPFAAPPP
jgi:lysophospholipase L1-like esterase